MSNRHKIVPISEDALAALEKTIEQYEKPKK